MYKIAIVKLILKLKLFSALFIMIKDPVEQLPLRYFVYTKGDTAYCSPTATYSTGMQVTKLLFINFIIVNNNISELPYHMFYKRN